MEKNEPTVETTVKIVTDALASVDEQFAGLGEDLIKLTRLMALCRFTSSALENTVEFIGARERAGKEVVVPKEPVQITQFLLKELAKEMKGSKTNLYLYPISN